MRSTDGVQLDVWGLAVVVGVSWWSVLVMESGGDLVMLPWSGQCVSPEALASY